MPVLNWDIFKGLPGSAEKNFEQLCRGIVRKNFGGSGDFRSLANQPGVEFHLMLNKRNGSLGDPGRWWGWQCKWYELSANGSLGATRRNDIKDGIHKAEAHVPGLTDWVLWTRRTLTKADQVWFKGLSSKMNLHLWTGEDVDNLLAGHAAVLRGTYFGELVLTPSILREHHEQSVAPIRARWQPDVHHVGEAENDLRRILGEAESWCMLGALSTDLRKHALAVENAPSVPLALVPSVTDVVVVSRQAADTLDRVAGCICNGDLDLLSDEFSARPRGLPVSVATAPRRLRSGNHLAGLYATNAVASCHEAVRALEEVESAYSSRLVAVLAPAGCGKTHLAAQLTAGTDTRPHGVLLHGRDLYATHTLDDLARRVLIDAQPVPSMEALLAAVDAAGQRAQHRLPVFIDGLNESEDPRTWKRLLAELVTTLAKYPYVLLVCTLRPEFVEDALPNGTRCIEIQDYGDEIIDAVREHFRYWKIDATGDASLPGFLRHPLTLRLFCEVTNPTRQHIVGVNEMPGSITTLFERYLDQVGGRIVELAHRAHRFYAHDVSTAIAIIANKLWESRARSIELTELRSLLSDSQRPWDQSLVRALEHEGVLLRVPSNGSDCYVPVYDLLGGHIIANALLAKHGQSAFETWIKEDSTTTLLAGDYKVRHPLADDVLRSLVGQVPRRFYAKQLWQLVDEPAREGALRLAALLEPKFLDAATVEALLGLVREADSDLLERLWELRGLDGHPLNAEALDRTLRTMPVADRDLRWTEWLRRNQDEFVARGRSVLQDLESLEQRWRTRTLLSGDRLRARWVMWTLTSTVRRLRDEATRTLYWFGRADPGGLFSLTIDSLSVNDAYVGERMLAAAYGVVMSHQHADAEFAVYLKQFLERLESTLIGPFASAPTTHYLTRLYARGVVAFATSFYGSFVSQLFQNELSFNSSATVVPLLKDDERSVEVELAIQMDFDNYTMGRLFDDRAHYDSNHTEHQKALAHTRGVIWLLGWRRADFEVLDRSISEDAYRLGGRGVRAVAERYGKKYSWIGFYTYAGLLEEQGSLPHAGRRLSDVDLDPSFPDRPSIETKSSNQKSMLSDADESHEQWIRYHQTSIPIEVLYRESIGEHRGPWIAVHGYLRAEDRVLGRATWMNVSALLTSCEQIPFLLSLLKERQTPWLALNAPSDYYVFAGEIPWYSSFGAEDINETGIVHPYSETIRGNSKRADVEILAHEYAWEKHRNEVNQAGCARVPSKLFSARFNLSSVPNGFNQVQPDGRLASITLGGVEDLLGDILYIREDLLLEYIDDRKVVWYTFGQRELYPFPHNQPDWFTQVQEQRTNEWCAVVTESDLDAYRKELAQRQTPRH